MKMNGLWWWIDRWRKSTAYTDMTLEQQGAYRNLLDEATLRGGGIPDDDRILGKACGDALAWRRLKPIVLSRFYRTEDAKWRNETLDEVIRESQRRSEKQARWRNKQGNGGGNANGNAGGNGGGNGECNRGGSPDPDPDLYPDQAPDPGGTLSPERGRNLAFAGRILQVPRFLDTEFVARLNGQFFDLTEFYNSLDQRLAQTGEPWDLRWIRDRFSAESPSPERRRVERDRPFTPDERTKAERVRRSWGRCQHEPKCDTHAGCIATIIRVWREEQAPV